MQAIPRKSPDTRFPRKAGKFPRKVLNLGREIPRTAEELPQVLDPGIPIKSKKMPRKVVGIPTKARKTPRKYLDQLIPRKC